MSETIIIVVSIFGLIGVGYLATRVGLLSTAVGDRLAEFVFTLAIPCLLFETLATADFHDVSPWRIRPAIAISVLKLVLLPVLVFLAANAIGLPPIGIAALTLTAACPAGVNTYLIAQRLGTGEALASNTVLISTGAGVLTVTLWLSLLQRTLGP